MARPCDYRLNNHPLRIGDVAALFGEQTRAQRTHKVAQQMVYTARQTNSPMFVAMATQVFYRCLDDVWSAQTGCSVEALQQRSYMV